MIYILTYSFSNQLEFRTLAALSEIKFVKCVCYDEFLKGYKIHDPRINNGKLNITYYGLNETDTIRKSTNIGSFLHIVGTFKFKKWCKLIDDR